MQPTVFYCLLTICMLAYKTFSNVTLCHVYTRPLFDEAASWGVSIFGFIRKNVCFSGAKDAIRPVIFRAPLPKPHPIIPEKQKLYLKNLHGKLIIFFSTKSKLFCELLNCNNYTPSLLFHSGITATDMET